MISVRRTNGLPQASFRFHFTADTLALLAMCFPLTGALRTFTFKNNVRAGRTELLGNLVTRASEIWRDTVFFQGASMTPILLAFRLCSYFYYFWIFQSGYGQFLMLSGYGKIFSQDIKCTYCICIVSFSVSYIHTPCFSV